MIYMQQPKSNLDLYALDKSFMAQAYTRSLTEQRRLPTKNLQEIVEEYDRKSNLELLLFKIFSDEYALLRIGAARQILEERRFSLFRENREY